MGTKRYIRVTLKLWREADQWLGRCPELGTATYGDSLDETLEDLREAILAHLSTLEDVGECTRFLRENGIRIYNKKPCRYRPTIDVPLLEEDVFIGVRVVPVAA